MPDRDYTAHVSEPEVRKGQIWIDNDPRCYGRRIRIIHITETYALVRPADPKAHGRATRIRLDRFRPTSNGYRLESEPTDV